MKRLAFVILLLTVLALGAFMALNRPTTQASPDVTITVNRVDDTDNRDAYLTLREAMKLAIGQLAVQDLHEGECHQVSTATWVGLPVYECYLVGPPPGVSSADTIVFDTYVFPPSSPATVTLGSTLPTLSTGGDTVDGTSAGVIVDGVGKTFDCFDITSAENTIRGLKIYNCMGGVVIHGGAHSNTVGGGSPGEGNVISGNFIGVDIWGSGSAGNVVKGNYIGTDATGTSALDDQAYGIQIEAFAGQNSVGGSSPGEGNIISGNRQAGVAMYGAGTNGNMVKGNFIGTDAAGTGALPNGIGVQIAQNPSGGPQNNTIGGTATGQGNVIAYNDFGGVSVYGPGATGNSIRGNSIHSNHSNGGKGIENDTGGNTELAPPAITGFGSVVGTACPNCTIDIYSDDEDEGRVYEGSTTASGAGAWSFVGSPEGPNVTATATDAAGNTSEFSAPCWDSDNDDVCNSADNCPSIANPSQTNTDGHHKGDACDPDDDDDGYKDSEEQAAGSDPLAKLRTPEVCDGGDDDGDTQVDEGFPDNPPGLPRDCMDNTKDNDSDGVGNGTDTNDDNSPNADPFSDALENHLGTNRAVMCAAGSNDNDPFDNDLSTAADVSDILAYVARNALNMAIIFDDDYWRRGDLTNDGAVDVSDILTYVGYGVLNLWCPYGM